MPFGLYTAPTTFQKLMHTVLSGNLFKEVVVYIDDILIFANNRNEHDRILSEVFQRIQTSSIRINPIKCKLYQEELVFLGHTINKFGIKPNSEKVNEIVNAEIPRCTKELRSFRGKANYYGNSLRIFRKSLHLYMRLLKLKSMI